MRHYDFSGPTVILIVQSDDRVFKYSFRLNDSTVTIQDPSTFIKQKLYPIGSLHSPNRPIYNFASHKNAGGYQSRFFIICANF